MKPRVSRWVVRSHVNMEHTGSPQPFNPADLGTPEAEWQRLLHGAETWTPRPGPHQGYRSSLSVLTYFRRPYDSFVL